MFSFSLSSSIFTLLGGCLIFLTPCLLSVLMNFSFYYLLNSNTSVVVCLWQQINEYYNKWCLVLAWGNRFTFKFKCNGIDGNFFFGNTGLEVQASTWLGEGKGGLVDHQNLWHQHHTQVLKTWTDANLATNSRWVPREELLYAIFTFSIIFYFNIY